MKNVTDVVIFVKDFDDLDETERFVINYCYMNGIPYECVQLDRAFECQMVARIYIVCRPYHEGYVGILIARFGKALVILRGKDDNVTIPLYGICSCITHTNTKDISDRIDMFVNTQVPTQILSRLMREYVFMDNSSERKKKLLEMEIKDANAAWNFLIEQNHQLINAGLFA